MVRKLVPAIICLCLFMSVCSFAFGEEKKLHYGTGIEYFASDRLYDNIGNTEVIDQTVFEFRVPIWIAYSYNKYLNLKLTIPYVYRKAEYVDSSFDKTGKGIGDIDLSNEIVIKEETESKTLLKIGSILTIPAGTDNIQSCDLGENELPTGGPLFGSQGVHWFGRTWNLDFLLSGEKTFNKNLVLGDIGYKITFPTSSTGFRIDTGDIFHFGLGYKYKVNEETMIGLKLKNYSSGRIKLDSHVVQSTSGIIGTISPDFAVKVSDKLRLSFDLNIPLYGKNEYKGLGYTFNVIF